MCFCCGRNLHRHQIHLISYGIVSCLLITTGLVFTVFAIFQKQSQIGKIWLAGPTTMVIGLVLCGKVFIDWGPAMYHARHNSGEVRGEEQMNIITPQLSRNARQLVLPQQQMYDALPTLPNACHNPQCTCANHSRISKNNNFYGNAECSTPSPPSILSNKQHHLQKSPSLTLPSACINHNYVRLSLSKVSSNDEECGSHVHECARCNSNSPTNLSREVFIQSSPLSSCKSNNCTELSKKRVSPSLSLNHPTSSSASKQQMLIDNNNHIHTRPTSARKGHSRQSACGGYEDERYQFHLKKQHNCHHITTNLSSKAPQILSKVVPCYVSPKCSHISKEMHQNGDIDQHRIYSNPYAFNHDYGSIVSTEPRCTGTSSSCYSSSSVSRIEPQNEKTFYQGETFFINEQKYLI